MAKNYISLILAVIAISVSVVGCANRQAQESQKVTMSKVDTRAMGKAWDDHSIDRRPAVEDRNFVSEAVEKKIQEIAALITNEKLRRMFINCFPNTLDTPLVRMAEYPLRRAGTHSCRERQA